MNVHESQYAPGSLVFCHSADIVGKGIRLAEWLRFRKGAWYNHVATLNEWNGTNWTVIQAEARGVTDFRSLDEVASGGSYTVVDVSSLTDTDKQMAFLRSQVGQHYGFLTIASIVTTLILPMFINVMLPNTWICSAVAAEGLRAGGWIHSWPDLYQVNPAQLYETIESELP